MKKAPSTLGTQPSPPPTQLTQPSERISAERAPAQKRTAATPPESPSKRRVQDSPIHGSRDALDATTLVSQLAPELKDVLRATMRDIVPDVVEKAMASGSKTRAERAVDQANKRECEARGIVLQHEATISGLRAQVGELQEQLKAAQAEGKQAVADKVRAEGLLQEKAIECDRALSILNRTYGHGSSPTK